MRLHGVWADAEMEAIRASEELPGYVVLNTGRGTSGGASNWSSGFLPTTYQGVLFRNQGEPVLNLNNPAGALPFTATIMSLVKCRCRHTMN